MEFCLVDTNILVRWVREESAEFRTVDDALARIADSGAITCYTSQILGELWNALTRPVDRNGYGLTPPEAELRAVEVEASLRLLPDTPRVHRAWRQILIDYRVSGVQVHDARIVAAMRVYGVHRILTFNAKDFARYDGIEAVNPLQLAKSWP